MTASIACFVTPHGFGHAARTCAVVEAIHSSVKDMHFEIFTTVPEWFFSTSLTASFQYHDLFCDVGLVQRNSLVEDPQQTASLLDAFLKDLPERSKQVAARVKELDCRLVLCDIAPFGLAVAKDAGLTSVLIENFTWDWIYRHYDRLERFEKPLADLFAMADLHLQSAPPCIAHSDAELVPPISRRQRTTGTEVRSSLGISTDVPLVMVTMGGIPWELSSMQALSDHDSAFFVVPGIGSEFKRRGRLVTLPHRSAFYHPDLTAAADVVIGKLGYSTVAECYQANNVFAYIPREHFPESQPLGKFVEEEMAGSRISSQHLIDGSWVQRVASLISQSRQSVKRKNGSLAAAHRILEILE